MEHEKVILALLIAVVLASLVILGLATGVLGKSEHMASFRDFPGQKMATPAMLSSITNGFNKNSDTGAEDPYLNAMLDISSTDNAWTTANWQV